MVILSEKVRLLKGFTRGEVKMIAKAAAIRNLMRKSENLKAFMKESGGFKGGSLVGGRIDEKPVNFSGKSECLSDVEVDGLNFMSFGLGIKNFSGRSERVSFKDTVKEGELAELRK